MLVGKMCSVHVRVGWGKGGREEKWGRRGTPVLVGKMSSVHVRAGWGKGARGEGGGQEGDPCACGEDVLSAC